MLRVSSAREPRAMPRARRLLAEEVELLIATSARLIFHDYESPLDTPKAARCLSAGRVIGVGRRRPSPAHAQRPHSLHPQPNHPQTLDSTPKRSQLRTLNNHPPNILQESRKIPHPSKA